MPANEAQTQVLKALNFGYLRVDENGIVAEGGHDRGYRLMSLTELLVEYFARIQARSPEQRLNAALQLLSIAAAHGMSYLPEGSEPVSVAGKPLFAPRDGATLYRMSTGESGEPLLEEAGKVEYENGNPLSPKAVVGDEKYEMVLKGIDMYNKFIVEAGGETYYINIEDYRVVAIQGQETRRSGIFRRKKEQAPVSDESNVQYILPMDRLYPYLKLNG